MILGAYRNPPYRSPTQRSATSASPPPNNIGNSNRNQSPKRKLNQDIPDSTPPPPVAALRIDTGYSSDGSVENGQNSPRSKVAERLNRLEIRQADNEIPTSSQSPRKKLKRNPRVRDLRQTPEPYRSFGYPEIVGDNSTLILEIGETPGAGTRTPSPSPVSRAGIGDDVTNKDDHDDDEGDGKTNSLPPQQRAKRMLSPPPPSPARTTSSAMAVDSFPTTTISTQHPDESNTYDPKTLTWQDSEITGHEITSPDDDGEGINGIGFKPTPAIAQVRSQRRRQQLNEWKAREARDARQKRMDRRRGGGVVEGGGDAGGRRHVRFMDSSG